MQSRNLSETTVNANRVQPGNPVACERWSLILALPFILVTAKSPDQKQEVSNQIKSQNRFVAASGSPECLRELRARAKKIIMWMKCRKHTDGWSFALATNMAPDVFGLSFGGLAV